MKLKMRPGFRYWLHVEADGTEQQFDSMPSDRPALTIDVVGHNGNEVVELTYTRNFPRPYEEVKEVKRLGLGPTAEYYRHPPPGHGWQEHDASYDFKSTIWRRTRRIENASRANRRH